MSSEPVLADDEHRDVAGAAGPGLPDGEAGAPSREGRERDRLRQQAVGEPRPDPLRLDLAEAVQCLGEAVGKGEHGLRTPVEVRAFLGQHLDVVDAAVGEVSREVETEGAHEAGDARLAGLVPADAGGPRHLLTVDERLHGRGRPVRRAAAPTREGQAAGPPDDPRALHVAGQEVREGPCEPSERLPGVGEAGRDRASVGEGFG